MCYFRREEEIEGGEDKENVIPSKIVFSLNVYRERERERIFTD